MTGAARDGCRTERLDRPRTWVVALCAAGYVAGVVFPGSYFLGLYLAVACAAQAAFPSAPRSGRPGATHPLHGWLEIAAWAALPNAVLAVIGTGWFPWDGTWVTNVAGEGAVEVLPGGTMLLLYLAPLCYPTLARRGSWRSIGFVWGAPHAALTAVIVAPLFIDAVARWEAFAASYRWIGPGSAAWVAAKAYYQPGLWEELYYRAFLYRMLRMRTTTVTAAAVSSTLFVVMHDTVVACAVGGDGHAAMNLVGIFVLGMAMAFVYERSGSIVPCILFHGSVDGVPYLVRAMAS